MRPYRGKRIDGEGWVYGWYRREYDDHIIQPNCEDGEADYMAYPVDPSTVGQSFEYYGKTFHVHDVIAIPCYCDSEYGCSHGDGIYEVVWNHETAGYALKSSDTKRYEAFDNYDVDDMHIIGNRWDNPELLEVKE